jgi:hypothetical protein
MARGISLMTAAEEIDNDGDTTMVESEAIEVPGDVRDSEDEVEDSEEVLDEAGADVDTLEDIKDVLEDAADKGEGIDETAAKIVEITTEAIYARLGFRDTKVMGSLESFQNVRSRVTATRMAAEAIGDRVSAVWEAIKKFFRDLRDKIKELWAKYVTAVGRLKSSAEAMRRKVSQTTGTKKEETFTDKNLVSKVLDKNGKVNLASTLGHTIKEITGVAELKDELIKTIEDEANVANLKKKINEYSRQISIRADKDVPENRVMVGNKGIKFYMDESDDKITFDVFEAVYDNDQDGDTEIEVLDKKDLEFICSEVIKVCNSITAVHDRKENGDKKVEKELDKRAKTNEYEGKKGVIVKVGERNMRSARVVRELLRANSKMSYLPEKIAISGCHVALSYVNKCLRQYGK